MKKSQIVTIGAILTMAIASCQSEQDSWVDGKVNGKIRDTTIRGHNYRHYNGMWYPVYHGMISPTTYRGSSYSEINRPSYTPTRVSSYSGSSHSGGSYHSGGFGSSSHFSSAS